MKPIKTISGTTVPLAMNDVDTDLIIPAQYLTSVSKEGYGQNVFRRLRDSNPDFALNQPQYQGANILITRENFGCGSSREHAVWALTQAGIDAVIGISFADIFFNNASKNGLVLITQPHAIIDALLEHAPQTLTIDMLNQTFTIADAHYSFKLDPFHHYCFVNGLDELDYLLSHKKAIDRFKSRQSQQGFSNEN